MVWGSVLSRRGSAGCSPGPPASASGCGPAFARTSGPSKTPSRRSRSWWGATRGTWGPSRSNSAPTGTACRRPPRPATRRPPAGATAGGWGVSGVEGRRGGGLGLGGNSGWMSRGEKTSICLSVCYLSIYVLSICLSICYQSIDQSAIDLAIYFLSIHIFTSTYSHRFVCLYVYLPINIYFYNYICIYSFIFIYMLTLYL